MAGQHAPGTYYNRSLMAENLRDQLIDKDRLNDLRDAFMQELEQGILPFWLKYSVDEEHGGFYGRVDNEGRPV